MVKIKDGINKICSHRMSQFGELLGYSSVIPNIMFKISTKHDTPWVFVAVNNPAILLYCMISCFMCWHDDVIKWKHFLRYWPFVRGIHRSPVNSPYKGQWRGTLMFSLICARINRVNNRQAGDLRRNRAHYDDIVTENGCHAYTVLVTNYTRSLYHSVCIISLALIEGCILLWYCWSPA